jgi:plastocyanin/mono/diheme cytochrome c family protein
MSRVVIVVLVVLLGIAGAAALTLSFFLLSARSALDTPNPLAIAIAENGKTFLIPADVAAGANPAAANPDTLRAAQRNFTARCVVCHGEDGKGNTPIGAHIYPRAADLTAARTQSKKDGALFWIIQNGIPHTGMPGWKDLLNDDQIWQIVTYVRQLPNGIPQVQAPTPTPNASGGQSGAQATVPIENSVYEPKELTVDVGTTVVWMNKDDDEHTVTSKGEPGGLDSPTLKQNDNYQFTFTTPGTYNYVCKVHDFMEGTVIVK